MELSARDFRGGMSIVANVVNIVRGRRTLCVCKVATCTMLTVLATIDFRLTTDASLS